MVPVKLVINMFMLRQDLLITCLLIHFTGLVNLLKRSMALNNNIIMTKIMAVQTFLNSG